MSSFVVKHKGKIWLNRRTPSYTNNGKKYGYPDCCIKEFSENAFKVKSPERNVCFIAAENSGFVPCYYHSCQILNNEIKITDLINNRVCEKPFKLAKRGERWETKNAVQALLMLKNGI